MLLHKHIEHKHIEHKPWVPKSLRDPHITRVLGTPGPHIPSDMGAWGPHITRNRDWDPQIGGSPFHADTGMGLATYRISVSCPDPVWKNREGNGVHTLLCLGHYLFNAQLCYMCSLHSHMKIFMNLLHSLTKPDLLVRIDLMLCAKILLLEKKACI